MLLEIDQSKPTICGHLLAHQSIASDNAWPFTFSFPINNILCLSLGRHGPPIGTSECCPGTTNNRAP